MKKKITIIIDTMIDGGAHRVACIQANKLANMGFNVTLVLLVEPIKYPYFISNKVNLVCLLKKKMNMSSSFFNKIKRHIYYFPILLFFIKKNKPDLIISHMQGINWKSTIIAKILNLKVITCEHYTHFLPAGYRKIAAYIERHFIYQFSNIVTVLTSEDKKYYDKFLDNVYVLHNPLPFKCSNHAIEQKGKTILAAGNLDQIHIKGWDSLLNIFCVFLKQNPSWKLKIAGASHNNIGLSKLKSIADNLGISKNICFLGNVSNIRQEYLDASIFIVTSRHEGFSMVLTESMSQGCAAISFDCKYGPSEIINHMNNGVLVEDQNIDMMVYYLDMLANDQQLRNKIAINAIQTSNKYDEDNIINELVLLMNKAMSK